MAVGTQYTSPQTGYKRIDSSDRYIIYNGTWTHNTNSTGYYNSTLLYTQIENDSLEFYFYGTKFILLDRPQNNRSESIDMYIDEVLDKNFSVYNASLGQFMTSIYEKESLEKKIHHIKIVNKSTTSKYLALDCIDIDSYGKMCTQEEYDAQNSFNFQIKIGDETITSEKNVTNYTSTLVNGERQLLLLNTGEMYLSDGNGGYIQMGSGNNCFIKASYFGDPTV